MVYIFYIFDPENRYAPVFGPWAVYWKLTMLFLFLFDVLMALNLLYFRTYRLVQEDEQYWLEIHGWKGLEKRFLIREFYYWWSYGWSVFGNAKNKEKGLGDWIADSVKESSPGAAYGRQAILFVGLIDPYGNKLLLYQVLPPFIREPRDWPFRKQTQMKDGVKALKLKKFVKVVGQLKK